MPQKATQMTKIMMNKPYKYILFDLDGTITASGIGIMNAASYALAHYGIINESAESLSRLVGPPLLDGFVKYFGLFPKESENAVKLFREYYSVKGIYENSVYDGISELLADLKAHGLTLIIATSKPDTFAKRVLERFGLCGFFDYISASDIAGKNCEKSEIIEKALSLAGAHDKKEAIMIGDRMYDILGAKKIGIDSIGVLYGYGSENELREAGASYIAASASDIGEIIKSHNAMPNAVY